MLIACINVRSGRQAVVAAVVTAAEMVVVVLVEVKVEVVVVEAMLDISSIFGEYVCGD